MEWLWESIWNFMRGVWNGEGDECWFVLGVVLWGGEGGSEGDLKVYVFWGMYGFGKGGYRVVVGRGGLV